MESIMAKVSAFAAIALVISIANGETCQSIGVTDCKSPAAEPVKVIFDTDMYSDWDDAGALACLHALADAGECEILATIANTCDCMSVAMCEIVNSYYGRPHIPVACARKGGKKNGRHSHIKCYGATVERYMKWVKHRNSCDAPDAVEVYRRILSAQPDRSVVVCSVGFLNNLRYLLESSPDEISKLNGRDLVAKKVKLWVAMACKYPDGKEFNSVNDPESSRIALSDWPTPVIFTDFEYGRDCFTGRVLAESGIKGNPVADVFAQNLPSRDEIRKDPARHLRGCNGMGGRGSWDETAVLIAVRGTDPYFNVSRGAYRMVGTDGANEWVPDEENGPHLRITERMPKREVARVIDELMMRKPVKGSNR